MTAIDGGPWILNPTFTKSPQRSPWLTKVVGIKYHDDAENQSNHSRMHQVYITLKSKESGLENKLIMTFHYPILFHMIWWLYGATGPPNCLRFVAVSQGLPKIQGFLPLAATPRTAPKAFYGTPGDLKACPDALGVSWEERFAAHPYKVGPYDCYKWSYKL